MIENLTSLLGLSFGLGLLHALDADHILAVSALSSENTGRQNARRYALRWSLGHGVMLLAIILLLHFSGSIMSAQVSQLAERVVGGVLIILGLLVLFQIRKKSLHIHFHQHKNTLHAHWHQHAADDKEKQNHQHEHKAVLIGSIHGLAGSAPLIALIPLSAANSLSISLLYLFVFSLGVFVAMLSFGGLFGSALKRLSDISEKYASMAKSVVAVLAIVAGVHLVSV